MSIPITYEPRSYQSATWRASAADLIRRAGRLVALAGVVLPLLLIGGLKFTQFEVEALKPMIGSAPWLSWMYAVFGEADLLPARGRGDYHSAVAHRGTLVSTRRRRRWSDRSLTFLTTTSLLLALPIWEPAAGGFPALNGVGGFLIKDVALLGISLVVLGESMARSSIGRSEIEAGRHRPVAAASGSRG